MSVIHNKNLYTKYFEELHERIVQENLHIPTEWYGTCRIVFVTFFYIIGLILIGDISIYFSIFYFYLLFVELGFISHDLIHDVSFGTSLREIYQTLKTGEWAK